MRRYAGNKIQKHRQRKKNLADKISPEVVALAVSFIQKPRNGELAQSLNQKQNSRSKAHHLNRAAFESTGHKNGKNRRENAEANGAEKLDHHHRANNPILEY